MLFWNWNEGIRLPHINLELWIQLLLSLEHVDAGDVAEEVVDGDGGEYCELTAAAEVASDEVDTPPHCRLAKVIWMASVLPHAFFHEFAFVFRLRFESSELIVGGGLKIKSNGPEGSAEAIEPVEGTAEASGVHGDVEGGEIVDAGEEGLQHKYK